jgi:pathogenesis-related protein 1
MPRELLAIFFVVAACGGVGHEQIDADPNAPDADPNAPDADPNAPDADPSAPDARVTPDAPGGIGEPPNIAGITLFHNQVRAAVVTTPGIPPLVWNENLEATAAAWAAQCVDVAQPIGLIDHNPNRSDGHPYYVGENIYGSGGSASAMQAVELWAAEVEHYNYPQNTCDTGQICGHYTQVVWRNSAELGCARFDCPGLTYGDAIVCNYGPGGNYNGELPY